jgi:large exoprotein involved in heme utilization and adhesion
VTKFSLLSQRWQLKLVGSVAIFGALLTVVGESVLAQIVPDNTLGAEGSVVTPDVIKGIPSDRIYGGARSGTNLFHSFSQFNIGEGRSAYFTNPAGILNILSRVTGANRWVTSHRRSVPPIYLPIAELCNYNYLHKQQKIQT